jgi:LmbE family N-acetylglucosaminyl deacetylase
MLELLLPPQDRPLRLLVIGAHADDIEIGCGGTILRLAAGHPGLSVDWVVCSAADARREEAEAGAEAFLTGVADRTVELASFRDGFLPYSGVEVKEFFEGLKDRRPDLVLTHHRNDLHQDHRLVCELTWNTFRDHLILEFEVPKYDGDLGAPGVFVPLTEEVARRKVEALIGAYGSQREKRWFTEDTFLGLMRLRGMESNSPSGYAEAFYSRKVVLGGLGEPGGPGGP